MKYLRLTCGPASQCTKVCYQIRVEDGGAFLVLEIMPEFPLVPPHIGEQITAWGVVRHDGLHNWWELHPLIGWQPGNVAAPPATGTGGSD